MIKWVTGILISLAILVGFLTISMMTPVGLNIGLRIAKKAVPGELNYSSASGIPTGPIAISNFSYRHRGLEITVAKLQVKWQLFYLLRGVLHITQLHADNIKILLPLRIEETKSCLPFDISMHRGLLKNLSIKYPLYYPVHFKTILLNQIEFNYVLNGDIQAQITQPYPLNIYLHSKGTHNNYQLSLQAKSKDINWRMTGKGTRQWIELQTHEAHTLNGHLNAFVKVYFYPIFKWDINLDMVDLNLRKFNRNWPQQLTIQLKTKGKHKTNESPDFTLTGMLQTKKAYMHIAGEHFQQWNLAWIINVADFSSLLATAKGSLQSHGTISGHTQFSIINGEATGHNIIFPAYRISALEGHWNIDTSSNQSFTITINAQHVHTPLHRLSALKIDASGQPHAHHIKANIFIDNAEVGRTTVNLLLDGNLQNKVWRSVFSHFTIQSQKFGKWDIDRSSMLIITADHATISAFCLYSGPNHLCLQGRWNRIPLSTVNGTLTVNSNDAAIVKLFLPDTIQLHGWLVANLAISGRIERPSVNGTLQLEEGSIDFPQLQVSITQVHGSIDSIGSTINYRMKGYSQNQPIQITGQTRLDTPRRSTTLTVHGENLLIVNTHEYIIYGSGELKIDIMDRNIDIMGTLTIPRAILKPTTFSKVAALTGDVVFIGTDEKQTPWQTNINIKIIFLGDQILLDSLGAKGRLAGELTLLKLPNQVMIANGRITIIDGTFTTHGRTMDIAPHSAVTFIQSPITNPMLSVRATRTIKTSAIVHQLGGPTIMVGLDVEGTLHHPEVTLYSSDPNLTQADILSFLIFGHSAAVDTLNISGGKTSAGGVVDQISQGLGLTELGIEPQTTIAALGGPTQSAFVVGRYLSPRIYIRYSRGITTSINGIQIRYLISENWAIQTEVSSLGSGVDVLYSIERN
ncbi:translocation/assembly module TamB [Coxiella endosymbiont of Ornithodoros amblus]|uniref:translocation/assembly module TamB domain-containing protein n=1 Tax=Coxiella endosymbiont of Ornithodoros amblus TaxID=1656166 RepID=UPI00244DA4E6|nr:translocation/assembly module TamB domain-containing protein [Coxiella endosymbiont of Ornithodoros amblus]MBW5802349.1 translocation/assembly module TamB [Coxiella endosymbiont of Ornithodoros amblus]